jgi:hypothetical protein
MNQVIRELKRQAAGEKLAPEQLKGLIRAGYVYRNGDEHFLTDKGRDALDQLRVQPEDSRLGHSANGVGCSHGQDANGDASPALTRPTSSPTPKPCASNAGSVQHPALLDG